MVTETDDSLDKSWNLFESFKLTQKIKKCLIWQSADGEESKQKKYFLQMFVFLNKLVFIYITITAEWWPLRLTCQVWQSFIVNLYSVASQPWVALCHDVLDVHDLKVFCNVLSI